MTPSRKSYPGDARRKYQDVRSTEQIKLLVSPVRQDIIDTLESLGGEADIANVAAELGRPPDGLYYHFELLANAGLLQRIEADADGRRYRIGTGKGAKLRLAYRADARSEEAVTKVVDRLLQTAKRDFHNAMDEPDTIIEGEARELWAGRNKGWVNQKKLAEINRLLERAQQLLQGPRRAGCDKLVSLSFVIAPLKAKPGRRKRG